MTQKTTEEVLRNLVKSVLDMHVMYGSTSVCHGGIGGQAMTEHCLHICQNPVHEPQQEAHLAALRDSYLHLEELRG